MPAECTCPNVKTVMAALLEQRPLEPCAVPQHNPDAPADAGFALNDNESLRAAVGAALASDTTTFERNPA